MKHYQHTAKNWYEKDAWSGNEYVCGIDEVGRGCLAGPVVVAASIVPLNTSYRLLQDSKKLSARQREKAHGWIKNRCHSTLARASNYVIDSHNIYQTTRILMKKAFLQLVAHSPVPIKKIKYIVVDAMPLSVEEIPGLSHIKVASFPFGETHSLSIAAASILAKVERDKLIEKMSTSYPAYCLNIHKGYATKAHREALVQTGASIIHRTSFLKKITKEIHDKKQQHNIFD